MSKCFKLGFIPLTDSLPIIVADELGLFKKHDLDIELCPEVSWANLRDKLIVAELDIAHLLAPMLFATTLGISGYKTKLVTAFSFGLNGNAITLSNKIFEEMKTTNAAKYGESTGTALAELINIQIAQGKGKFTFATVYPFSCHNYQLRDWLDSNGVDTHNQVKFKVLPPEKMVETLERGDIDGFCVGEPWNSYAVSKELGQIAVTGTEIWKDAPEKVLATTALWHKHYQNEHRAFICALHEACEWLESHREESIELIKHSAKLNISADIFKKALLEDIRSGLESKTISNHQMNIFHRHQANEPKIKHALFLLEKMVKWGHIPSDIDLHEIANQTYLEEFYEEALESFTA